MHYGLWTKYIQIEPLKLFISCLDFISYCCNCPVYIYAGDVTPPQVTCPANLNSEVQCGTASGQLTFQRPTGTDNSGVANVQCSAGGVQLTLQGNQYIGNFPTTSTTISCTVTDACGLSSQCQFTATVSGGRYHNA